MRIVGGIMEGEAVSNGRKEYGVIKKVYFDF